MKKFVICINNKGYEVSLERGKVYKVLDDEKTSKHNLTRVVDESGEDYLFPNEYFVSTKLPKAEEEALVTKEILKTKDWIINFMEP